MDFYIAGGLDMAGGINFNPVFGVAFKENFVTVQVKHKSMNPVKICSFD